MPTELDNKLSPQFRAFLVGEAQDQTQGNRRFVPRNFLLDESVGRERAQTYSEFVDGSPPYSADAWHLTHGSYLKEQVFVPREAGALHGLAHQATNPASVPETFRHSAAFDRFGRANANLPLLRVEKVSRIAKLAGIPESELERLALAVRGGTGAGSDDWKQLKAALDSWQKLSDARPVYAGFLEYFADFLRAPPAQDHADWADELRDLLGLYHLGSGTRIVVFRYFVREIPKPKGLPDLHPLTAPTVLDQNHCEAFCPSPANANCGHTVDLKGRGRETPAGEILHPWIHLEPSHVFRVGVIRRPLPSTLDDARGTHLLAVRDLAKRPDYAAATDADLLGS